MKTYNVMSLALIIIVATIVSLISTASVYADTKTSDEYIKEYYESHYPDKLNSGVSKYAKVTEDIPSVDYELNVTFAIDSRVYYVNYNSSAEAAFVSAIKAAVNNEKAIEAMNGITENMGIEADVDGAQQYLSGFVPVVNKFMGIMVITITLTMFLFTSFDILFITMPSFQEAAANNAENGGIMASKSKHKDIRFITREAQYAVKNCTIENGRNPLIVYGWKRLGAHIVLAILIVVLLSRNLNVFTNIATRLAIGVINALSGL